MANPKNPLDYLKFIERAKSIITPEETVKAYKLFRTKPGEPETLYPLFVNANDAVPMQDWTRAVAGPLNTEGKVKSSLGPLAYRPGWHAGDMPIATHIGGYSPDLLEVRAPIIAAREEALSQFSKPTKAQRAKINKQFPFPEFAKKPNIRPENQVWAEVDMPADIDWQSIANERALRTKAGKVRAGTAHITDTVPYAGHYRYKTNPSMTGEWLIGGDMRVNRILDPLEVKELNQRFGVADLPSLEDYMRSMKKSGMAEGGLAHMSKGKAVTDAARAAYKKLFTPGYYHGSGASDIKEFIPSYRGATFVSPRPDFAESFLPIDEAASLKIPEGIVHKEHATMYPVSVNMGKHFDPAEEGAREFLERYIEQKNSRLLPLQPRLSRSDFQGPNSWRLMEDPRLLDDLKGAGYDTFAVNEGGVKNIGIFNPKNIRGKFAQFNPEDAESADFMKADGGLIHLAAGGKTPAWQRKEGKNPEGGLNAAGRASYNRETGGNLKAPQPEGGSRRDSFCARMKGMKKKLTSAETANDPDSRINKSLRKWKC